MSKKIHYDVVDHVEGTIHIWETMSEKMIKKILKKRVEIKDPQWAIDQMLEDGDITKEEARSGEIYSVYTIEQMIADDDVQVTKVKTIPLGVPDCGDYIILTNVSEDIRRHAESSLVILKERKKPRI